MQNIKTHLFSYNYEGAQYSLEIPASSPQEAKERLSRMAFAQYDGEFVAQIPASSPARIFASMLTWTRNAFMK